MFLNAGYFFEGWFYFNALKKTLLLLSASGSFWSGEHLDSSFYLPTAVCISKENLKTKEAVLLISVVVLVVVVTPPCRALIRKGLLSVVAVFVRPMPMYFFKGLFLQQDIWGRVLGFVLLQNGRVGRFWGDLGTRITFF